jgi:hypothetical protein
MMTTTAAAAEPRVFRLRTTEPGTGGIRRWQRLWATFGCGDWRLAAADGGDRGQ